MSQTTAESRSLTSRRGAVHRWSRTLIPTSKSAPVGAEAPSHALLSRAGFIRQVGAGIYDYLPLGWRTLTKISQIVREEMDAAGASEMLMPALEPIEYYAGTKRDVDYGDNLFRITDRHDRELALAPTHEEIITELMKGAVSSYRRLPLNLYQIQTKFRDEFRPRSGLLRCREFIMKDAYSFHVELDGPGGLGETYDAMYAAYEAIFRRCGLDFSIVEAESGPIGGSASHEFMVNCASGEDTILRCPKTGYAANVEKCETGPRPHDFAGDPLGDLEKVHTPGMATIEDVGKHMKVKPGNFLKTIVLDRGEDASPRWCVAVVRGDHDVNEGKARDAAGAVSMADEAEARAAGFTIGFVSPACIKGRDDAMLIVDPDAAQGTDATKGKPMFWAAGADEADHHVKFFNWQRELGDLLKDESRVKVADIRNAMAGDPSPKDPSVALEESRGIEVGHIFKLGTKYSDAMDFRVLDENQERRSVIMGCYGIGVSRTMAACVEMSHDDGGIVWPAAIAPYHVHLVVMDVEAGGRPMTAALETADALAATGLDVLIDDRDERPGPKFKDADLIGIPVRVTVGERALDAGGVELKARTDGSKGEVVPAAELVERVMGMLS